MSEGNGTEAARSEEKTAKEQLEYLAQVSKETHKLKNLHRHIENVQEAAYLMAERLIELGKPSVARALMVRSMLHDMTKFSGIEWEYLVKEDAQEQTTSDKLALAIHQHVTTNSHHPEYWGGIENMPDISIAEMVCDLYARASEFATDLRQYIKTTFSKKHNLSLNSKAYKTIKYYVGILLDEPLKPIKIEL